MSLTAVPFSGAVLKSVDKALAKYIPARVGMLTCMEPEGVQLFVNAFAHKMVELLCGSSGRMMAPELETSCTTPPVSTRVLPAAAGMTTGRGGKWSESGAVHGPPRDGLLPKNVKVTTGNQPETSLVLTVPFSPTAFKRRTPAFAVTRGGLKSVVSM